MTLRLLMALAGVLASGQTPPVQVSDADRLRSILAQQGYEPSAMLEITQSGFVGLHNRRTGVTCSMVIAPVDTSMDAGIFAGRGRPVPTDDRPADPMVRSRLSPCVE
jgi:hypothetical protein